MGICLLTPLVPTFAALLLFTAAASLVMPPRFVSINNIFLSRLQNIGKERAGWFRAAHVIGMTFLGAVLATTLFPMYGPVLAFWAAALIFGLDIVVFLLGIGRNRTAKRDDQHTARRSSLRQLFKSTLARQVAIREFSIQSLNAYFAFYIVIIALCYLHLPARTAGFLVAAQGLAFVFTLVMAGKIAIAYPHGGRILGGLMVVSALLGLATSSATAEMYMYAALLGCGLGLLQIINLHRVRCLG